MGVCCCGRWRSAPGIIRQFAACFTDHRAPQRIEHTVQELVAQRVYGLALGYEDLNDHEPLRQDPLLAVLVEKSDPSQQVLAGKSTLNRLELTPATVGAQERYKKIVLDHGAVDRLLVDLFLQAQRAVPEQIILDLDATDDPLYGKQLELKLPPDFQQQIESAKTTYHRFGQYSRALDQIRLRLEHRAVERAELQRMGSEMRIPGDFDVAQISWRPDYDPFFYHQLSRRARRIYLFRDEYIFDVERAVVVETPQLGHATYVFAKPRSMETFLTLYTKITKDDIRRNRDV